MLQKLGMCNTYTIYIQSVLLNFIVIRRGTFYQIIQGKLYRQKDCMFPSRCAGIEHFLLKLTPDLPDVDLVINVRDYPQSSKHFGGPLPIFSFSKVNNIFLL